VRGVLFFFGGRGGGIKNAVFSAPSMRDLVVPAIRLGVD
jgi:hypothetical protein